MEDILTYRFDTGNNGQFSPRMTLMFPFSVNSAEADLDSFVNSLVDMKIDNDLLGADERLTVKSDPLWVDVGKDNHIDKSDFDEHVVRLLSPKTDDVNAFRPIEMSSHGINALNGGSNGTGFTIKSNGDAERRMGDEPDKVLSVGVESCRILLLSGFTGMVSMTLIVRANGSPNVNKLLETLYASTHSTIDSGHSISLIGEGKGRAEAASEHALKTVIDQMEAEGWIKGRDFINSKTNLHSNNMTKNDAVLMSSDSLQGLVRKLVPLSHGMKWIGSKRHIFSYTVVKIENEIESPIARARLASMLARKQNSAYRTSEEEVCRHVYMPFDNITHAFAHEGGAVVLDGSANSFLNGFATGTGPKVYLPIVQLAYAERLTLTWLSESISMKVDFDKPSDEMIERLHDHLHKIYDFRLNRRYAHISSNTIHEAVHDKWREIFGSDGILQDLSEDSKEIASYLKTKSDEKRNKLIQFFGVFVVALTAISGLTDLNGLSPDLFGTEKTPDWMLFLIKGLTGATVAFLAFTVGKSAPSAWRKMTAAVDRWMTSK